MVAKGTATVDVPSFRCHRITSERWCSEPRIRTTKIDKKDLNNIVTNMVEQIVREHNIPEAMARGLIGFALMKNAQALVASIKDPSGAVNG